jgi:hypothetical protein
MGMAQLKEESSDRNSFPVFALPIFMKMANAQWQ